MTKIDPKSTGGEGFSFEDKVSAYFMSFMLSGVEVFPTLRLGRLNRVKFQRNVDGWELDDLILEFEKEGFTRSIAFSIKSNSQITAKKIPDDLIFSLWNQFTKSTINPFKSEHDFLGLITSGSSSLAKESLNTLTKLARNHHGADFGIHINQPGFTNQNVRDQFACFSRPAQITINNELSEGDIIKRFLHYDLELDQPTSIHLIKAFENFVSALSDGQAHDLWIHLQNIAKETRVAAGELGFSDAVKMLEGHFKFKGQRNFSTDLIKLEAWTSLEMEKIKSTFGSSLSLERTLSFANNFKTTQINTFIGESGVGKSNLIRQWVLKSEMPAIWLSHSVFRSKSLPELSRVIGVGNDLLDILEYGPSGQIIIIDGIDRISNEEDQQLLKSFLLKLQKILNGRHICVVCSQDQIWKTLVGVLSNGSLSFNVLEAPLFSDLELEKIGESYSSIKGLLNLEKTKQVLKNPKYLDLAIQLIEKSQLDTISSLSEPALVDGFWNILGSHDTLVQKQTLLLNLAVKQADEYLFTTSLSMYSSGDIDVFTALVNDGFVKIEDNSIRFSHDLYGDWLRLKFLSFQKVDEVKEIIQRKNNTFWNQAFRLHSLSLLEKEGFSKWKEKVSVLKNSGEDLIVDIFLDIAITSFNQGYILNTIKDFLFLDDCKYLSRFLERFLAYATVPNPYVMSMREEWQISEMEASRIYRIPLHSYWPNLLIFLDKNLGVITSAKLQMAQVAEKWLTSTSFNVPFRKEAAHIAFECANWIFQQKFGSEHVYVTDDLDKVCYQAMLAAYSELPEEVGELSLKLIGINYHNLYEEEIAVDNYQRPTTLFRRKIEKKIWPNGPCFKKDDSFQSVIFTHQNFNMLVKENASLASKILLAAIIENPIEWEDFQDSYGIHDYLGTDYTNDFYPPFHTKGPFLNFFNTAPEEAIKTLIFLTNFVTSRWEECELKRGVEKTTYEIKMGEETKVWKGNATVFSWSYDWPHCPNVLVSFLMSFEKWLYERIEKNDNVDKWIDIVLRDGESIAFLGLLVSVAKKSPKLFLDKLKMLLTQPYLLWWDQQVVFQNNEAFSQMISWIGEGNFMITMAREWFTMDHRKIQLEQWALHFLLNTPEMKVFFDEARARWIAELENEYDVSFDALACKFDTNNYKLRELPDGSSIWDYNPPESFLQKNKEYFEENDLQQSLLLFPFHIKQLLDSESFNLENFQTLDKRAHMIIDALKDKEGNEDDDVFYTAKDCALTMDSLKLIANRREIIALSLEEMKEIEDRIYDALKFLWNDRGIIRNQHDISEQKYDAILARSAGELCIGKENDIWIRSVVGYIISGPRPVAIKSFVKAAVRYGVDHSFLLEVIKFSFEFCKMQTTWNSIQYISRHSFSEEKKKTIKDFLCHIPFIRKKVLKRYTFPDRLDLYNKSVSKLFSDFISCKTGSGWPGWSFSKNQFHFSENFTFWDRNKNVLELESFMMIVSELPPIYEWSDLLKNGWISFCSEGLDQITNRLRISLDKSNEIEGTPYKQDTWIINIFAETFFFYDDQKLTDSLKLFLSIGPEGRYWLDDMGKHMFRIGSRESKNWDNLVKKIGLIFSIAESVESLSESRWKADEIWCSLIGLDDFSIRFLSDTSGELVKAILPIHKKFLANRSDSLDCIRQFVYLMLSNASIDVRLESLEIVVKGIRGKDLSSYSNERYVLTLSNYLTKIWQDNQSELFGKREYVDLFQELLSLLVAEQDKKALELEVHFNGRILSAK